MATQTTWFPFIFLAAVSLIPFPASAEFRLWQDFEKQDEEIRRLQLENQLLEQQLLERKRQEEKQRQEELERQRQIEADRARKKQAEEDERNAASTGSGFVVAPNGYLVTNAHVIDGYENIAVRDQAGHLFSATLVTLDKEHDLALLRIAANFKPLRVDQSGRMSKGQRVMAIGYPQPAIQGSESKVTDGVISSLTGINDNADWLQISVPIQGGNSGGPLINEDGTVIGVVVASVNAQKYFSVTGNIPQNVNYAIKAKVLSNFLASRHVRNSGYTRAKSSIADVDRATVLVFAQHRPFIDSIAAPPTTTNDAGSTKHENELSPTTLKHLKQMAANGDLEAQYELGNSYERGLGVPKNAEKAFYWWLKAAAQGHGKSQYSVGFAYQEGEGVERDLIRGYVWFCLAADQGIEDAKAKRDRLGLGLTQDQHTKGKRLLSGWKKGDDLSGK